MRFTAHIRGCGVRPALERAAKVGGISKAQQTGNFSHGQGGTHQILFGKAVTHLVQQLLVAATLLRQTALQRTLTHVQLLRDSGGRGEF